MWDSASLRQTVFLSTHGITRCMIRLSCRRYTLEGFVFWRLYILLFLHSLAFLCSLAIFPFFFYCFLLSLSHPVKLLLVQNLVECYWLLATCYILHDPSGKLGFSGWLIIFTIQNGELFTQSYTATEWVNSGTSWWRAIHSMQLSTVSELTRTRIMTGKIYKLRHWTMLWQRYWYSGVR